MTKLSASLPEDHGLDDVNHIAVTKPGTPFVVVGLVTPSKITKDIWKKTEEATVAFESLEVLRGDDAAAALRLLQAAHTKRTGETPLPFEHTTTAPGSTTVIFNRPELEAPADQTITIDPDTGEVQED